MTARAFGLAIAMALPVAAQVGGPPLSCTSSVPIQRTVRSEGKAELVADVLVTCTGGVPAAIDVLIPTADFSLSFNAPVTSRSIGPGNQVEALVLLDDPRPGSQFPCTTTPCYATGNGLGSGYYGPFGNSNIFEGAVGTGSQTNTVTFTAPVDPPGSGSRTFLFTNIRLDVSSTGGVPLQLTGISVIGQLPFTSIGGPLTVATQTAGLAPAVRDAANTVSAPAGVNVALAPGGQSAATRTATLRFAPLFNGGVQTRTIAQPASLDAPGAPVSQDFPGSVYGTESGFYAPTFPVTQAGANLGLAGLADWGTRLMATFSNLPSNVTVYVSLRNDGAALSNAPLARLTSTNASGAGAFSAVPGSGGMVALTPSGGSATAVWEVIGKSSGVNNFDFAVYVSYPAGISTAPGPITVQMGYAPLGGGIPTFLGGSASPVLFTFTATAPPPIISVSPGSMAFFGTAGGQNPPPQSITVTGSPGQASYSTTAGTVLPLLLSPSAGQTPGTTSVTVVTHGLAAGTYHDSLTVSGPQNSIPVAITLTLAPPPLITGLNPASVVVGSSAFMLNVSGANFTQGTTVRWNGLQLATTFRNAGLLTAQVSAALIANEGTASIAAVTTDGAVSNAVTFRIGPRQPPPPTISVSPGSLAFFGTAGGQNPPAQSITVTSTPDPASYSMTGGSVLPLLLNPSAGQTPGTNSVTVVTRGLAAGTYRDSLTVAGPQNSMPVAITLTLAPGPMVSSLDPASAVAGSPALTLNVSGANFTQGTVVNWNGSPLTTTFRNAGLLRAQVGAALVANESVASITAVTSDGSVSNAVPFRIVALGLTSVSPTTVIAGSPAFTLVATGTGFQSGSALIVGGTPANITNQTATQITATVAASVIAQPGDVSVSVTNPGGLTSNALTLTVTEALTLTRISPSAVTATGPAFPMTLTGTGFGAGATVQVGSTTLTPSSISRTQIMVSVPASVVAGAGLLQVRVLLGTASSAPQTLTVRPAPRITTLNPPAVTAGPPAFTLSVSGTDLASGQTVLWNGQSLTTSFGPGGLTAQVPAALVASAGSASISVATDDGVSSNSLPFTITPPASISALSPSTANAGSQAFTLTVAGANFVQGAQVAWNGQGLPTTFGSATSLTAQVAASLVAAAGTATVTVLSPGGAVSSGLPFTIVLPPLNNVSFTAPASAPSGQDQTITLTVGGTYPVELRGTLTLTFAPDGSLPDDPAIQFSNGTRTQTFTVPANAPAQVPPVIVKTGTVAGVITVTLTFATTTGQPVTSGVTPQRTTIARAAPGISSVTCARNTSGFTVVVDGFTNTREAVQASFDFTASSGSSLGTTQLTVQTGSLFSAWFGSSSGSSVGGVFRYTQPFTIQGNASSVASVTVRLGNAVGTSPAASCQLQ